LFRIPHKPPAGSLRVLHAPARRGGIQHASKTKINNLETDEFASNPPFSKNNLEGVILHGLLATNSKHENERRGKEEEGTRAREMLEE